MKKIFYFITALCVSALFGCVTASAQSTVPKNPDGLILNKWVEKQSDGSYKLYLDSYVTGSSIQTVSTESKACDVVLVLDNSGSMNSTLKADEKRVDVPVGTELSLSKDYVATINGKEYYVKGFKLDYVPVKKGYSFNDVSGSTYYYKSSGKYYKVEGAGKGPYYLKVPDADNKQKIYITESGGLHKQNKAASSNSADGIIWTGVLYKNSTQYYYVFGDTVPSNEADGEELYSGTSNIVYGTTVIPGLTNLQEVTRSSTTRTRLSALKDGVHSFLDILEANAASSGVEHRIAITIFGGDNDNHSILSTFSSNYSTLGSLITNLNYDSGGTPAHKAMEDAVTVMAGARSVDVANRVVVFFTDGSPNGHDDDGGSLSQNEGARQAINSAYTLKNTYNATVFSIGLFGSAPTSFQNYYLNNVSSNYNNHLETFVAGSPGNEAPHDKYQFSDGADLSAIFEAIAHTTETGGSTITLGEESAVVDVLTPDFALPAGADADDIEVFTIPVAGENTGDDKAWNPFLFDESNKKAFTADITLSQTADGNDKIDVTNFDFSKADVWNADKSAITTYGNWVGKRTYGGHDYIKGNKLRVVIPIVLRDDHVGGYADETNMPESGIYKDDEPIGRYPIPTIDLPAILIVKQGLKKGESAVFKVERGIDEGGVFKPYASTDPNYLVYNVVLTGDDNRNNWEYVIIKDLKQVKISASGEPDEYDYFNITETGWSWTYTTDATHANHIGHHLDEANAHMVEAKYGIPTTETRSKMVVFEFVNTDIESVPDHAESIVTNDFSTTGTGETLNSKPQPSTSK